MKLLQKSSINVLTFFKYSVYINLRKQIYDKISMDIKEGNYFCYFNII